jgi:hypothetical protein
MIVILQHINSKRQRQMAHEEWEMFKQTESGKVWKVVKRLHYVDMEGKEFYPPEISEEGFTKNIIIKKGAIAKADKDAKK